jgi:lipopolysaccharide export system protein LptA
VKFPRALFWALALLCASGLALFCHIFMISSYDREGYDKLNAPQEAAASFSTKSPRQGISKTLLLTQGDKRRIGVLKADASELVFEKEGSSRGLVEEMENAELIYQEELLADNMQLVVKLTADQATYDYERERLRAHDAELSRYRLPTHQLPDSNDLKDPFFVGLASEFHLEFQEREPFLMARQLKGTSPTFLVEEASFEKGMLHLGGGFHYEHPLGVLQAKSAQAHFEGQNQPPREILMEEGVKVQLKDGSIVSSPFSRLDSSSWIAFFHGLEGDKVVLERPGESLYLKSLEMTLQFFPPTLNHPAWIDRLTAEGEVEMGLKEGLKLQGRRAFFHSFTPEGRFTKALLTEDCFLTKGDEAEIYAEEIAADFALDQAALKTAHGTLQNMQFCANHIRIDKKEGKMYLDPPITLERGGTLETSGKVEITESLKEGKRTLGLLQIEGPSVLKMKDDKGALHTLKTHGTILVDPAAKQTSFSSAGEQIHFSDKHGEIYADQMQVQYDEVDGKLMPLKLHLEGNIRMQNVNSGLERYALAENGDYDFNKQELTLKAKRPARVIFYDLASKVQASAPTLVLKRNPETEKDEIKGLGNVRFLLAEDEWNELKKRFSFEK